MGDTDGNLIVNYLPNNANEDLLTQVCICFPFFFSPS